MAGLADAGGQNASGVLRSRVLHLADDGDGGGLASFLAEEDAGRALRQWFGDHAAAFSGRKLRAVIDRDIAEIDFHISKLLDEIQQSKELMALEARWKALAWLARSSQGRARRTGVLIKILNVTLRDLARDLSKAPEFDQSQIFRKIYEDEFGTPGGAPFGFIVCDYEIHHKPVDPAVDDVGVLRDLSKVAAAAFCPLAIAAAPSVFGVDRIRELSRREEIRPTFDQPEYRRFRAFQSSDEARFIAITVGRLLISSPESSRTAGDLGFSYSPPRCGGIGRPLWISGAFALADVIVRSFVRHAWPAAMRGAPDRADRSDIAGGVIDPPHTADFETDRPGAARKMSLEVALSDRHEAQLNALGFICPRLCPYTEFSAFYSAPTAKVFVESGASGRAQDVRMGAMVNYLLCVCRFAHYVKIIAREWVGSYKTASDCQHRLQKWIDKYCIVSDGAGYADRARFPLRRARILVSDSPGKPGAFECKIQLQPHFQLDYVVSEFELTTEIEANQRAA